MMLSSKAALAVQGIKRNSSQRANKVVVRATGVVIPHRPAAQADEGTPYVNLIPNNGRWPKGIPPVMGGHLMDSGVVSPISVSKGAGLELTPHQFQYPSTEGDVTLNVVSSEPEVPAFIAKTVFELSSAAIAAKGSFTLVLSGGSLPKYLDVLSGLQGVEWEKFYVFFVDERNVPLSSPDSNFLAVSHSLLSKVPIPASNVFAIHEGLTAKEAAVNYEGRLLQLPKSVLPRAENQFPVFDLILLGVGPDGHVASLFPNRPQTAATSGWVVSLEDSPKPPSARITFTLPVINAAKDVVIVALGASKAEVVERVLEVQALPGALPAQVVRPTAGKLQWLLDTESVKKLHTAKWGNAKAFPRSS